MNSLDLVPIASLSLAFGRVDRATLHPDGIRHESDTDHAVMLGLLAIQIAWQYPHLNLNIDALSTLALVHDLVEAYAGDTNTLGGLTDEQAADKAAREHAAAERIRAEIGGGIAAALGVYEGQTTREARFIRYLDKITPKLTHALNGCEPVRRAGHSAEWLRGRHRLQGEALRAQYPEFADVLGPIFDHAATQSETALEETRP